MKKKKGTMEMFIASLSLMIVPMIIIMNLRLRELKITKNFIEDGLVASNLASATIDLKEYGTTHKIVNDDFSKSFQDYSIALKDNLNLDSNYIPQKTAVSNYTMYNVVSSKVIIDNFIIYNVIGNDIQVVSRNPDGSNTTSIVTNGLGTYKSPDGVLIKSTTIYSRISFKVKGYLNDEYNVFREKSVDITDQ